MNFQAGSSVNAILDFIAVNGMSFYPAQNVLCSENVQAQTPWRITLNGQMLDSLSNPVVGATVVVTDASGQTLTAITDSSGNWTLTAAFANGTLKQFSNPVGYSNGPFTGSGTLSASFNNSSFAVAGMTPTPIKI